MSAPPFSITPKIVNLIAGISSILEVIKFQHKEDFNLRLRKINKIQTIHSSLAIEGNTLSEKEIKTIIDGQKVIAPLREIIEVKNAIKCYDNFNSLNPFEEKDFLKAHNLLMTGLLNDAGHYRSGNVGVSGEKGLIHMAPPYGLVPTLMHNLFIWLKEAEDHLLIKSCVFHYEVEFIHPFIDGNGRIGRLWQSLLLNRFNPIFSILPVESMVYYNQQGYYDAIEISNRQGDSNHFIEFMLAEILEALINFSKKDKVTDKVTNKVTDKPISSSEKEVLTQLKANPYFTILELASQLDLSESGIKRILRNLRLKGLIRREGSNKTGKWIVINP